MENQDHIFTPKVTNPMVMNPRKNSLESLPDKEFKRMIITLFKYLKEDKNKELKECGSQSKIGKLK